MAAMISGVDRVWGATSIRVDDSDDIRILDHKKVFNLDSGSVVFSFTTDNVRTTQGLISKDANGRSGDGDLSVWLRHGQVYARIEAEGRIYKILGGEIEAGKPAAVAVTFGDEGFRLFVDGKLVDQNDYRGGIQGNAEDLVIGALNDESKSGTTNTLTREFRGEINEIGIYRDALSVEAIRAHAEGQGVPNPKSENDMNLPQAFWALDDVRIDNLDDARVIPHQEEFVLDDGTLAFAVTPDSIDGRQGLISKDADFFGTGGHLTVWLNNGKIVARLQSDSRSYEIEGGEVAAGKATDIAVTFGSEGFKLYVAGNLVDSHGYTGGLQGNSEPLVIGASQWGSSEDDADKLTHEFKGALSDIGLYSSALSKDEVATLANSGPAEPQPEPEPEPGSEPGAPVISDPIGTIEIGEGQRMRWELTDYFSDPQGDPMTYTLQSAPDFVSVNGQGRLIVNTDYDDTGSYSFSVIASDGSSASAPLAVKLNVGDVADTGSSPGGDTEPEPEPSTDPGAPVISDPIGTIEIGESERMRWELSDYFSDPQGDPMTYTLQSAPDFVSVNGQGRLIVNTDDGDDGSYSFTIAATDGKSTSAPLAVKLNVADSMNSTDTSGGDPEPSPGTGNEAPVISDPLGTIAIDEGVKKRFDLDNVFSDADGDPLNFVLSGDPDFVWINSNNQLVVDASDGDNGKYDFKVTASDGDADISTNVSVQVADTIDGSGGGSGNFTPNSLVAQKGILTNGKIGAQEWGDDVTLTGYDVHGKLAEVRWDPSEFDNKELGFGVKGEDGRWDTQIDYFEWDGGARSEKLVIDFNGDVTNVVLRASMMGLTEGGDDQMETGLWRAYNDAGKLVGKGLIGPDQSMLGFDQKGTPIKEDGTYGAYPIEIDPGVAFERLELEATQFDHGDGHSFQRPYGENSSDFGIMGVDYLRLETADDFLF